MKLPRPDTLRGQAILVFGAWLLMSHLVSLVLFIIFSASTVTLEREDQITDRVATITRLIEHAPPTDRRYLAEELSGDRFRVTIDTDPLAAFTDVNASTVTTLIRATLGPMNHDVAAEYGSPGREREVASQRLTELFRTHETLLISIDLSDGRWLNFHVSGSAWDHVFSIRAIPSVFLMALGAALLASWAVNRPLRSLTLFVRAAEQMGMNVHAAQPIAERGPREVRDAARAFNRMQARVQRLLDARNEMLGAISHDFRTPLTRLRLRAEAMRDADQKARTIQDLDEMESLISLALDFARSEVDAGGDRKPVDLKRLLEQFVGTLNSPSRITLDAAAPVVVCCQELSIRRTLANVVDNALFYGQQVRISLAETADEAEILVDDDGPGIEPRNRERVFTPFHRLESSRSRETGGAGLGLSIAQTLVHSHGGTIRLLDSPLGGLQVRIALPKYSRVGNDHDDARTEV